MASTSYQPVTTDGAFKPAIFVSLILIAIAAIAAYNMEHAGHYITGMNNRVIWGMPHVLAIFLIISASGALNIASIASVFDKAFYKPLEPFRFDSRRRAGIVLTPRMDGPNQ